MDEVVSGISNAFLGRPVLDKTELTGIYDLKLTYTPDIPSNQHFHRGPGNSSASGSIPKRPVSKSWSSITLRNPPKIDLLE
jgi:uncharacterized protein (TIGR03435 family)